MLKRILCLIFAAFFIVCCCSSQRYVTVKNQRTGQDTRVAPVFIDSSFSDLDKKNISHAVEQWNFALNGHLRFEVYENEGAWRIQDIDRAFFEHGLVIIKLSSKNCDFIPDFEVDPSGRTKILAWVNKIGGYKIYVVRDRLRDDDVFYIMQHEIGHALGARHKPGKNLMYFEYYRDYYMCIDKQTTDQAAEFLGIPPKEMNYCYY
mgnify:CR=1 FL=1|jgi:hypothetical protein